MIFLYFHYISIIMNLFDKSNINYSILAIFFLFIILIMLFDQYNFLEYLFSEKKVVEDFNLGREISKIGRSIGDGISKIEEIPKVVSNLGKKVGDGFQKIPGEIGKLGSQLENIGDDIGDGIVNAANETGKGFEMIGDEFVKIGETVVKIPPVVANEIKGFVNDAVDEIEGAFEEVEEGVAHVASEIERGTMQAVNKIEDVGEGIIDEVWNALKVVFEEIKKFFVERIACIFVEFGMLIFNTIISPIIDMFVGLGLVFYELFKIIMLIINKIISLPGCSAYYMGDAVMGAIGVVLKSFVPNFLKSWFRWTRDNIVIPIWQFVWMGIFYVALGIQFIINLIPGSNIDLVGFVKDPFGYQAARNKCFAFPIKNNVKNMEKIFIGIGDSFASAFGDTDYGAIGRCFT